MKKVFIVLFLLIVIFNNGYSTEEDNYYHFLDNILDDLQRMIFVTASISLI